MIFISTFIFLILLSASPAYATGAGIEFFVYGMVGLVFIGWFAVFAVLEKRRKAKGDAAGRGQALVNFVLAGFILIFAVSLIWQVYMVTALAGLGILFYGLLRFFGLGHPPV